MKNTEQLYDIYLRRDTNEIEETPVRLVKDRLTANWQKCIFDKGNLPDVSQADLELFKIELRAVSLSVYNLTRYIAREIEILPKMPFWEIYTKYFVVARDSERSQPIEIIRLRRAAAVLARTYDELGSHFSFLEEIYTLLQTLSSKAEGLITHSLNNLVSDSLPYILKNIQIYELLQQVNQKVAALKKYSSVADVMRNQEMWFIQIVYAVQDALYRDLESLGGESKYTAKMALPESLYHYLLPLYTGWYRPKGLSDALAKDTPYAASFSTLCRRIAAELVLNYDSIFETINTQLPVTILEHEEELSLNQYWQKNRERIEKAFADLEEIVQSSTNIELITAIATFEFADAFLIAWNIENTDFVVKIENFATQLEPFNRKETRDLTERDDSLEQAEEGADNYVNLLYRLSQSANHRLQQLQAN